MRTPMHEDEVLTDTALARRLLLEQQPRWADLPLTPIEHHGTDHDVYRLGPEMSVRLPRTAWASTQAHKEAGLLPVLAPRVTLAVPQVLAHGRPTSFHPHPWSVQTWLPGADLLHAAIPSELIAEDLAAR